ncbi:hypothetical protein J3F83DRAFT_743915, partial [Trichoderma novae-zelandiae]
MTTDAAGISASRAAAFRHHLLKKTTASGPTLVDRDMPAPPVVSRSPPIKTPSLSSKPELDNRGSVPGQTASVFPQQITPIHHSEKIAYSSPIRLIDRDCANPSLHGDEMHADVHHPGLLEGADFCDNGVQSPASRTFTSSTHPSSPVSDISKISGEMHRVMSSGDISVTEVTVPIHRHKGHSIAVKVRPAFSYYPTHHPVFSGDRRGLDYSRSANKARPFGRETDDIELGLSQEDDDDTVDGLDAVVSGGESRDGGHRGDGHQKLSFPTSKLRASPPELPQEKGHQHHGDKPKVRPFTRTTDESVIHDHHFDASSSFSPENGGSRRHDVGESADMQSSSHQGLHIHHKAEQQSFGGSISQSHVIHSPIPVSKVRPIFTTQPSSTSGHESHSSAAKIRPVGEPPSATATQDKPYFSRESGQSLHS